MAYADCNAVLPAGNDDFLSFAAFTGMAMIHKEIIVSGKVQGVYFRASTKSVADKLGVRGAVKNLPDGNVWIAAEGMEAAVEELIDWCQFGPSGAIVTRLHVTEGPLQHFKSFDILHR